MSTYHIIIIKADMSAYLSQFNPSQAIGTICLNKMKLQELKPLL